MAFVPQLSLCSSGWKNSAFRGLTSNADRMALTQRVRTSRVAIEMKKTRYHQPKQPPRPEQFKIPEDGTPVFSVFVRSPRAQIWYPLGAVTGDARSKTLVNALKSGWGKVLYQNTLDKGIAQTIFGKDGGRYVQAALRQYPQLKRSEKSLEFGYRVSAVDLEDKPIRLVTKEMALTFFQWATKKIGNLTSSESSK